MTRASDFTETEAMICVMANMMEADKSYWVVGGGPPRIASLLAQILYIPNLTASTEDGVIAPQPMVPLSPLMQFVSARANYRGVAWKDMNTVCSLASTGFFDYGMLATLQVDPYGNINSSFLGGDYNHPGRRYGGAGGANEIASMCWRTILMTTQEKRKFVKKMDFISSPGFLDGSPGARERTGLPTGSGPYRLLTPDAMFGYDEETRYMKLIAIAEWVEVKDVLEKMDFEPLIAPKLARMTPPTEEELDIMRVRLDPMGVTLREGKWIHV